MGRNVRKLRERGMYSRPELAERAGVSLPGITRLELGEVPRPRRTTLEKLARVLGVPVETLLEQEAAPAPLGAARSELPDGSEAGRPSGEKPPPTVVNLPPQEVKASSPPITAKSKLVELVVRQSVRGLISPEEAAREIDQEIYGSRAG